MFVLVLLLMSGCGSSTNINGIPDPEKIVPEREVLIENLEDGGYIVYGLSSDEASKIFELYCSLYPDDYYILSQNGNYVYCVSDKKTFSKAGFTSTANVGVQYIHN